MSLGKFNMARKFIGGILRTFAKWTMPNYWVCCHCGCIKNIEEEVICWKCGIGEMIYKG